MHPVHINEFDVQPSVNNHFAWMRTQLGLQRTLMAAVRTSVSLIGFGFTVAQFFQRLQNDAAGASHMGPETPRNFGLVLIGAGVVSLAIFIWQYHSALRYLSSGQFSEIASEGGRTAHVSTNLTAYAVILIGVVAFASIFLRF